MAGVQLAEETAEAHRPSSRVRLASLTGLRFAAAFLVFGFHLQVAEVLGGGVFAHGAIGVSFFFLLSGFVLTWSARPGEAARATWRKRAAKIYPNHLVTALAALAAGGATIGAVAPNLLLIQSWDPDPQVYFGLNTVSWSLSCEAFFYLLFPFLLRGLDRLRALRSAAVLLAVLVWCLPLLTLDWSAATAYWFLYVCPVTRLAEFCLGMVLARAVAGGRWPRVPAWAAGVLLCGAYVAVGHVPDRFGYVAVTVVPLALLIAALAGAEAAGRNGFWSARPLVWLGEVSFAFYMVHQLVIRTAVRVAPALPWWVLAPAALVAALGCAVVLWRCVERPLNDRLRTAGRARPQPSV